jgi:glyoxylase-like metal-dependent hydrolase (beta-lactamase superfamily II)
MLQIQEFCFNAFQENTYVIYNEKNNAIIIDPGCYLKNEQTTLVEFISEQGLTPTLLLNTHCHLDHVFGNNFVAEKYGLTALFHQKEQAVIDRLPEGGARWGVPCEPYHGKVEYIRQDQIIAFDEDEFIVLETPGHSPGSVCFYHKEQDFLIGGDLIFKDGVGRTDLPGSNPLELIESIRTQILPLPETMKIYSGHGPATTWGREKKSNPYILHMLKA